MGNKMNKLTVSNIYMGKPDAKDEILAEKSDEFLKSYVIPPNLNIEELITDDRMFIYGNKGTGKTALLLYIEAQTHINDACSATSFILFKTDYGNIQRMSLDNISTNIIKSVNIENQVLKQEQDFEYIWRWIFFKHIIEENRKFNDGLFIRNSMWEKFEKIILSIEPDKAPKRTFRFPHKVKLGMQLVSVNGSQIVQPEMELDFDAKDNLYAYQDFAGRIDEAAKIFNELERSDIPFYIFVDELEVFFADKEVLKRDLRMIRDLVITVKYFNSLFLKSKFEKTKIICSVRTEVVNSIIQFVPAKEINKVITGFSCFLAWAYDNTSYRHPIFKIWLKRIELSERKAGNTFKNDLEIYKKWFCENVDNMESVSYILNNTWHKPRDIVRFIHATKNTIHSKKNMYTPGIFDYAKQEYSDESLKELKEELNALYFPEEIETIIMCLTGYKISFTYDEIQERVEKYFGDTFLKGHLRKVLSDLYRIGILGNIALSSNLARWEYKGNQGLIIDEEWKISVHRALWKAFSLSEKHGRVAQLIEKSNNLDLYGMIVKCTVYKVVLGFALVNFEIDGEKYHGSIHISKLTGRYVRNIFEQVKIDDVLEARVLNYSSKHLKWNLECVLD